MARPHKCRRVCSPPGYKHFGPKEGPPREKITLTLDEYETLRLIDYEGLDQNQCALQMNVGRTTIQAIYARARQKVAAFLVGGFELAIEGGQVALSGHSAGGCGRGCCHLGQYRCNQVNTKREEEKHENCNPL